MPAARPAAACPVAVRRGVVDLVHRKAYVFEGPKGETVRTAHAHAQLGRSLHGAQASNRHCVRFARTEVLLNGWHKGLSLLCPSCGAGDRGAGA